jgi:hypothetical protein
VIIAASGGRDLIMSLHDAEPYVVEHPQPSVGAADRPGVYRPDWHIAEVVAAIPG